jgi:hypothetical protein
MKVILEKYLISTYIYCIVTLLPDQGYSRKVLDIYICTFLLHVDFFPNQNWWIETVF